MKYVYVTVEQFIKDRNTAILSADIGAVKAYCEHYNVPYKGQSDVVIMRGAQKALDSLQGVGKTEKQIAWLKYSNWLLKHGYTRGQSRRKYDAD